MSKVYDHLLKTAEQSPDSIPKLDIVKELQCSELKVKGIYFRNMNVDSRFIIGSEQPSTITIMTYLVGEGFSKSTLELIGRATKKTKIRIAFCLVKDEFNTKKNEKCLKKIKKAFEEIFKENEEVELTLLVNPQTHIKLLQYNDELFIGSMNFSKTADDINESINKGHKLNYRSHELLVNFYDGKSITDVIWEKLSLTKGSHTKKIDKYNYDNSLTELFENSLKITINESKKELKEIGETLQKQEKNLLESVRDELTRASKLFLSDELSLNFDITGHINSIESEEIKDIYLFLLARENHSAYLNQLLENCCFLKKIPKKLKNKTFKKISETIDSELKNYQPDLREVEDNILNERLDLDKGEGDINFGPKSKKALDNFIESNNKVVIECMQNINIYLARFLLEHDLCVFHDEALY
ncbi:hypothetical protein PVB89_004530 [Vibrio parahaemolyticus]|nr:hypothetical protein [Vibrio parahaemolyticus]EKM6953898.1 hypothetical protein [Vibrio parahaemolyticus]ELA9591464.1 hypothetical protein [Vibrio parahaemolyticus]